MITRAQLVRDTNAPSRCAGSDSSTLGPPKGLAMHQTLMAIAEISAIHSSGPKETLCEFHIANARNVSQATHRRARCHHVRSRSAVSSGRCRAW